MQHYIGTSGWYYNHWKGIFYPESLTHSKWLEYYSMYFSSVELNNSFYRLPSREVFTRWKETTPEGFLFSVKVSRYITHIRRLKDVKEPLQKFIENATGLDNKLGPLLYQLPPNMKCDKDLLENFLDILPQDYRHVFEFRNNTWFDDTIFTLLKSYGAGICVYDMPGFTCPFITTGNTGYIRFHGSGTLYSGNYTEKELYGWVKQIEEMSKTLTTIYIYFNNDAEGHAVKNAGQIIRIFNDHL